MAIQLSVGILRPKPRAEGDAPCFTPGLGLPDSSAPLLKTRPAATTRVSLQGLRTARCRPSQKTAIFQGKAVCTELRSRVQAPFCLRISLENCYFLFHLFDLHLPGGSGSSTKHSDNEKLSQPLELPTEKKGPFQGAALPSFRQHPEALTLKNMFTPGDPHPLSLLPAWL